MNSFDLQDKSLYGHEKDLLICPYNNQHMIRRNNFPLHLVKCREENPDLAKDILICRYSAMHHVHRSKMKDHLDNECLFRRVRDTAELEEGRQPLFPWAEAERNETTSLSSKESIFIEEKKL